MRAVTVPATSVAVLYFDNLSRDTADRYLADGLTEELTSRLGDVERLRVSGTSAVRRAQQAALGDLPRLGRSLGVRYLVEGSVRRSGEAVRISVRLLRAGDGVRVWGATYDRTMTDMLALQEEIGRQVVTNVAGQLLPAERARLAARPTADPAAYPHYLRGTWYLARRSAPGAFAAAVASFDSALGIDPSFTAAAAKRAHALLVAWSYGAPFAPRDSLRAWGIAAAQAALALDSTIADVWLAQSVRSTHIDQNYERGLAAARRAVALDPRSADAHHNLAVTLAWMGAFAEAEVAFRRALAIDAGRAITLLDIAELKLIARQLDAALAVADSALAADPQQSRIPLLRARILLLRGEPASARAAVRTAQPMLTEGLRPDYLATLAWVEAALGDSAGARVAVAELRSLGDAEELARAMLALGNHGAALGTMEQAAPSPQEWYSLHFPEYDGVRADPRFQRVFAAWRPRGAIR